jgi:hypothetical protein
VQSVLSRRFSNHCSNCLNAGDAHWPKISSCLVGTDASTLHKTRCALLHEVPIGCHHTSAGKGALPLQLPRQKFRRVAWGKKMLAPRAGSPLPGRWARGPPLVPCRPRTPTYQLEATTSVTKPPRAGVHRRDQLERFSVKREHNQHT